MLEITQLLRCPTPSVERLEELLAAARKFTDTLENCSHSSWQQLPAFLPELHVAVDFVRLADLLSPPEIDSGIDWPLRTNTGLMALQQHVEQLARQWDWTYMLRAEGRKDAINKLIDWTKNLCSPVFRVVALMPETLTIPDLLKVRSALSLLANDDSDEMGWLHDAAAQALRDGAERQNARETLLELASVLPVYMAPVLGRCRPLASERELQQLTDAANMIEFGIRERAAAISATSIAGSVPKTQRTVLFLAANPFGTARLRPDEELKRIEQGFERAKLRDHFRLVSRWAVTSVDLQRAVIEIEPEILHFTGHGSGEPGLTFENECGDVHEIPGESLARLLRHCAARVKCVVLNACYSEVQADSIRKEIDYVIGMGSEIGDEAAIHFSVGFYDALGAGKDFETAYQLGCSAIDLKGFTNAGGAPEYLTPILKRKTDA